MSRSHEREYHLLYAPAVGCIAAILVLNSSALRASDWIGAAGNWSSNASPGWNGTGVPDSQGAIAQWITPQADYPDTTQDIGVGVTVGAINYGNNNDMGAFYWRIGPDNGITLNQDGAGSSFATISNSSTNGTDQNALWINGGVLTLADNLHVVNTASGSLNVNGAIQLDTVLAGAGDITFNSTGPISSTATSSPGAIWVNRPNTFTGNVLVQQGLLIVNNQQGVAAASFTPLGNALNVVTIGESGSGGAALLARLNNAPLGANPIVIAPAALGETRTFGAASNGNFTVSTGSVTLNGDLNLRAGTTSATAMQSYTGNFSGAGNLTKTGTAIAVLSGNNTNSGTTTISTGGLIFARPESLYNNQQGPLAGYWDPSKFSVQTGAGMGFNVGSAGEFSEAQIATLNALGSATGGYLAGSFLGLNPTIATYNYATPITNSFANANPVGLAKAGANRLTTGAAHTYTGPTSVLGGILQFTQTSALYSGNTANWDAAHLIVPTGTLAFSVGGGGEFSIAQVENIATVGTATGGFLGGNIGIDTTNAGANTVYSANLVNPNSGANVIGLMKIGTNQLTMAGSNSYTGPTIVSGGTLRYTGSHVGGAVYDIGPTAGTTGNLIVESTANLSTNANITVGNGGTGTVTQNSGTVNAGTWITMGELPGSMGTYNLIDGSVATGTVAGQNLVLGFQGTGKFHQTAGSVSVNGGALIVGWVEGSKGEYTLDSGSISVTGPVQLGINPANGATPAAEGTFTMNGGSISTPTDWVVSGTFGGKGHFFQHGGMINAGVLCVAQSPGAVGEWIMDSANSTPDNFARYWLLVGDNGDGKMTQNAGTVTVGNVGSELTDYPELYLGTSSATGKGVYDLAQGATLTINGWSNLGRDGGNGTFNNRGTFGTTQELRIGAYYYTPGGTAVFNNLGSGIVNALHVLIGAGWEGDPGDWSNSSGTFNQTGTGSVNATGVFYVGQTGANAVLNQSAGTIDVAEFTALGRDVEAVGTHNLSGGSFESIGDYDVGDYGTGTLEQTGGTIETHAWFVVAYQPQSEGHANVHAGSIICHDNSFVGLNGNATERSMGTLNMSGGNFTIIGDVPAFTGNLHIGWNGIGVANMSGGTIDMITSAATGTNNSASHSFANSGGAPWDLALDGNLSVGGETGTGTLNLSGGTINVASNVLLGGADVFNQAINGGTGTITITGGKLRTGMTSPTGGDMILGFVATSSATVNLQGGLLEVNRGSGKIGRGLGSTAVFNFTGGTLRVKEYNATSTGFAGSLGPLVQNGNGSVLDVTANDTTVNSSYDLGQGWAFVGPGQNMTAQNVLNSAGAGVISVGNRAGDYNLNGVVDAADYVIWRKSINTQSSYELMRENFGGVGGGSPATLSVGAGNIGVDTLALNNGTVTAGSVTINTALRGNGTINGAVTMGATASVSPGLSPGKLNFGSNLSLGSSGILVIELGGTTPVTGYDQIDVTNQLTVGGTLQVNLINGFVPSPNTFHILNFSSLLGTFSTVNLPPGNWNQTALYSAGNLTFVSAGAGSGLDGGAVPEPATLALIPLAGLALVAHRWRR